MKVDLTKEEFLILKEFFEKYIPDAEISSVIMDEALYNLGFSKHIPCIIELNLTEKQVDKAFDIFPFLTFAENFCIRFGRFYFYPIFVSIIYVAFMVMCFVYYAVVRFLYKVEDDHLQLRLSAIDLYEKLTKKTSRAPKEFVD